MKRKLIQVISCLCFLIICHYSSAQNNWLWKNGGAGNDEALDNCIDQSGNIYTTGYFSQSCTFNQTILTSFGSGDVFISKQTSNGNYAWAVQAGGISSDRAYSITTNNAGEIIVAGFFSGTATFGSIILTATGNSQDVFVAKLDATGNFLWAKRFGGNDIELALSACTDVNGNIILTGQFKGTSVFGSNTYNSSVNPNTGLPSYDIFVLKLDDNGNFLWSKHGKAKYDDRGLTIDADASGNIFVAGQFSDTLQFSNIYNNNAYNAGFVLKLDGSGNELWIRTMIASLVTTYSLKCYNNDVLVTGDLEGVMTISGPPSTVIMPSYSNNIFLLRFNTTGNLLWEYHAGSANSVSSLDMDVDASGNAYAAGLFSCVFTEYSLLYGEGIFNSAGYRDVFLIKVSSSGQLVWERQFGGSKDDFCSAMSVLNIDKPVIAGSFERNFNVPRTLNFISNVSNHDSSSSGPAQPNNYCGDNHYRQYLSVSSSGSKDIFSSIPFDITRKPYDYFDRTGSGGCTFGIPQPSIADPYHFVAGADTLHGCGSVTMGIYRRTGLPGVIGPDYVYHWSNNTTGSGTVATASGYYSVTISNEDQCRSYFDSVYVQIESPPVVNPITASTGVMHVAAPIDSCYNKLLVQPNSNPVLYGTNMSPGYISFWDTPGGIVYGDSVLAVPDGVYVYKLFSPVDSCLAERCVRVVTFDTTSTSPHLCMAEDPILIFTDSVFEATDTVTICKNDLFQMKVVDSLLCALNIEHYLINFISWYINFGGFSFYPQGALPPYTFYDHLMMFKGSTSGNCMVTVNIHHPITDSVLFVISRNFYLNVLPLPIDTVKINGPASFCPGDTVMLTISGNAPNYSVTGPGIISLNATHDTLYVNKAGTYKADYILTDAGSGCSLSSSKSFLLKTTPSPKVTLVPSDGVICPGDSVLLIGDPGLSYNWIGPLGNSLGTSQNLYVQSPGYYHYEFVDSTSCQLISEFKEVKGYTTPYLNADPASVICPGGSIVIHVNSTDSAQIQWLPPLSGNSSFQTVSSPGIYSCTVNSCDILTQVSIQVTQSSITAQIGIDTSPVICNSEPVILTAPPNMLSYLWQPINSNVNSISVSSVGTYYLFVTDSNLCNANDSIVITSSTAAEPVLNVDDVCKGDVAIIKAQAPGIVYWFDALNAPQPIFTGPDFTTPPLLTNTTYYATNGDSVCRSGMVPVTIEVEDCTPVIPNVFTPDGDGTNEGFVITYEGAELRLIIFNRWGQQLAEEEGHSIVIWDGRTDNGDLAAEGVYYYILLAVTHDNKPEKYSGFVQLLR